MQRHSNCLTNLAQVSTILWLVLTTVLPFILDTFGQIFTSTGFPEGFLTFLTLFPPFALYRGFAYFSAFKDTWTNPYSENTFLAWGEITPDSPLATVLITFALQGPMLLLLVLWLDQVVTTGYGVPQHPLFFLGYTYDDIEGEQLSDLEATGGTDKGHDVSKEEARVHQQEGLTRHAQDAVRVLGLEKIYPGMHGTSPKHAVQGLTVGIKRGECFGMLGPNGAGKTTSINMLIGLDTPTRGTAILEGFSILTQMQRIYSIMGICPQHDLLWPSLTAQEHLNFYGTLKNLKGDKLKTATAHCLKSVNLYDVRHSQARTFSGGMKRRLSAAIALVGEPLVVFLDEPSTGLDPSSRRLLWKCIEEAKANRAILLTTHSMEEAEGLCDRLGIFVDGKLRVVGEPVELTRRYGGIFLLTLSGVTAPEHQLSVHKMVAQLSPEHRVTYALAGTFTFEVPSSSTRLSDIFETMLAAKQQGFLTSWGISSCTLEDAFIKVATSQDAGQVNHPAVVAARVEVGQG